MTEARTSTQADEHDIMSINLTEKDGKDLYEDNDPGIQKTLCA